MAKGETSEGIKILVATGLYPPEIGGPATYSKLLYDELPKRGIAVEVLPFSHVRHLPNVLRQIYYFLKVLRRGVGCDIIYAQDAVSVGWPAFFANFFLQKVFLVKIVGDQVWEQGKQRFGVREHLDDFPLSVWQYGLWLGFLRFLQFLVVRHCDRIIVPSEYLKKTVLRWGVDPGKIAVIYNAFDVPDVSAIQPAQVGAGKMIVSVGRLVPWKGFSTLIEIVPALVKRFPGLTLVIVGDGPERANLQQTTDSLHLGNSVVFTGQVSHQEVLGYIKVADVFVLNTAYEGLSHVLLEAMSLGAPIVTTNVGGNPELIINEQSGLLVEHDDKPALSRAVIRVLEDGKFASRLGEQARERTEGFSTENMLKKTVKILNEVCESS